MIGTTKRRRRLAAGAISAAFLAAAMPVAAAGTRPDDRSGIRGGPHATAAPDLVDRQIANVGRHPTQIVRADDRAGVRGPGSASHVMHAVVATSRTFDWGDAATGAAVTFGAISVLGVGALAGRRRGRVVHPAVTPSERSA